MRLTAFADWDRPGGERNAQMDPESDDIDARWWAAAADEPRMSEYEPVELLSTRLGNLSQADGIGEFQKMVLDVLALVTSAMLNPGNWLTPFTPAIEVGNRRSAIPADLTKEQVALLARMVPLVDRPGLRARLADVAWTYGDRSDVALLDAAIDAYRAVPLRDEAWFSVGRDSWRRAFELARRRGTQGDVPIGEMTSALKAYVLGSTVKDGFPVVECAALLRENGRIPKTERTEVAEHLVKLAAIAADGNPHLSRRLEREATGWFSGDAYAINAATDRVARTYITEADARVAADPVSGAAVEGQFLEKAIATFRSLPRSYRLANGIDDLVDELRRRLHASRETTLEIMIPITSGPIDLTDAVSYARETVSGHADPFKALAVFATLAPPLDADRVRTSVEESLEGSLSHIFGSSTYSRDARKVASREAGAHQPNEQAIEEEIVRHVTLHAQITAQGLIWPALEILTYQHRYDRSYMTALCAESATVPEGHAALWGAGLAFGLDGDFGPAVAVLVPQLEQAVRAWLKRHDAHTLFVDEHTGVESEKSLNALLAMGETVEIFGAGMVMELRALLVVQGGVNLRNDIAHGLLNDAAAWSYHSMYVWWFCLRLMLWPVIQMLDETMQRPATA